MSSKLAHKSPLLQFLLGSNYDMANEDSRRDILIIIVAAIAVTVLSVVSIASFIKGQQKVALIDFSATIILITLIAVFRFTHYKKACCYVGVAIMYFLYNYLFFTGAAEGMTYMWHYTFPFFAIFLIGRRHGAIATMGLFIPVFAYVLSDSLSHEPQFYSINFTIRFIPSVTVALIFSYLFEQERVRFRLQTLDAYREQEHIIQERTDQLRREVEERENIAKILRQSQKMEAIGVMAGGVAHDLNNILSGIVGYPELLRRGLPKDSQLAGPLETIEKSGKRAAAVVEDLLTLARNTLSIKEPTDLNEHIEEILSSPEWLHISEMFPDVKVESNLQPGLSLTRCSQVHIRKCLLNLFHNGIEAAAPKGTLTIITRDGAGEKRTIGIFIKDTGPGIAPEHIEHIFEPFYTTKQMGHSGSGLGLAVVWNTVMEHEGTIHVQSDAEGAVFELHLPATDCIQESKNQVSDIDIESLRGVGSILVVDDEPELRMIARGILELLGYSAIAVKNGKEAIQIIKKQNFDIILLDMILGDGPGGYEIFKNILDISPYQKAVIASGFSSSEDIQKTLDLGASSVIKKPYDIIELGSAIRACLQE